VLPANDQGKDMLKSLDLKIFNMPQGEQVFVEKDEEDYMSIAVIIRKESLAFLGFEYVQV
jgi:hypothetical protein